LDVWPRHIAHEKILLSDRDWASYQPAPHDRDMVRPQRANALHAVGQPGPADWVKNAMRNPRVAIRIGKSDFEFRARLVRDNTENALARRLLVEKYSADESGLDDWTQTALPIAFDLVAYRTQE
jgi:F420H(2)-dependent quinone reductase